LILAELQHFEIASFMGVILAQAGIQRFQI